jgi:hypothetical protein
MSDSQKRKAPYQYYFFLSKELLIFMLIASQLKLLVFEYKQVMYAKWASSCNTCNPNIIPIYTCVDSQLTPDVLCLKCCQRGAGIRTSKYHILSAYHGEHLSKDNRLHRRK